MYTFESEAASHNYQHSQESGASSQQLPVAWLPTSGLEVVYGGTLGDDWEALPNEDETATSSRLKELRYELDLRWHFVL